MHDYQRNFIRFALDHGVIRFGEFTLKSGRISPYFFNAGLFNTGKALAQLGDCYAQAIQHADIDYDMVFGPAYKGIPLASSTAIALAEHYQRNVPFSFNRKEAKDHGEGGNIVGAPLRGKVLIIDDVITAGTAFRQSLQLMQANNASLAGLAIALDRQERGNGKLSAIQEIQNQHNIPVIHIITLQDLCDYLREENLQTDALGKIEAYQAEFGIKI